MPLVLPDRVLETSTTTGTGTYTLAGAVTGFQSFAAVGNGNTCQYVAYEVDGNGNPSGGWEVGLGTYTASGTTLARTTIYASSNAGAAVNWAAGTRRIAVTRAANGTHVVLQPGGTAGTDELRASHDGSDVIFLNPDTGNTANGFKFQPYNAYNTTIINISGITSPGYLDGATHVVARTGPMAMGAQLDTGINRAAARVIGLADFGGSNPCTIRSIPLSPAQITANQDNYAPGVSWLYRLSTDASRDITGLAISQVDGQFVRFCNVGSNNIVLKHQDTNSTAANRFLCGGAADITLAADEQAEGWYDATTSRWRVTKL